MYQLKEMLNHGFNPNYFSWPGSTVNSMICNSVIKATKVQYYNLKAGNLPASKLETAQRSKDLVQQMKCLNNILLDMLDSGCIDIHS